MDDRIGKLRRERALAARCGARGEANDEGRLPAADTAAGNVENKSKPA